MGDLHYCSVIYLQHLNAETNRQYLSVSFQEFYTCIPAAYENSVDPNKEKKENQNNISKFYNTLLAVTT